MERRQHGALRGVYRDILRSLEHQLDSLTPAGVWRVIVLSIVFITAANLQLHAFGLHVDPLYVLPLCLAGWRLGLKASLGVAAALAVLVAVALAHLNGDRPAWAVVTQMALFALMLAVVVGVVSSFRHSLDRERVHASRDGMTGALNRHAFTELADAMLAAGEGRPLVLAFIDLDGFKAVNDRHGHHAGDRVLEHFARGAMRELRGVDYFGRIGGDEFAVLALAETEDGAHHLAGFLHRRFSAVLAATGHEVTCSMGALIVPAGDGRTCAELLREADRLMYSVKAGGKNGVRIAPAARSTSPALAWRQDAPAVVSAAR